MNIGLKQKGMTILVICACMYRNTYIKKAQKVLFTHHLLFHELCNSLAFFLIIKPNPIYGHCKCTSNTNYEHLLKQQFYLVDI